MTHYGMKYLHSRTTTDGYEWYEMINYIKRRGLEEYLQKDSYVSDEDCCIDRFIVVDEYGNKIPYSEVMSSLDKSQVKVKVWYFLRISPETEYNTEIYPPSLFRRSDDSFRYRVSPVPGITKRQWSGSYKNDIKYNKKYWADLQEYGVTPLYTDGWGCLEYRIGSRSWKRNSKKRKQWG